ncbi:MULTISPECIES: hypothetical protein [unclassified Spirillospora]|uniref:hypothetical protein n=1 Tax=unclassified Spirillospora TaxID=2642701 RepID=UPI00370FCC02
MHRTHEMRMIQTAQSGHEEWACTTCGRRILLRWPPHYDKRIIEPGDEKACHVGSATADTPTEPVPPATTTGTIANGTGPHEAAADEAPVTHIPNGRRWLRETGMETYTAPARPT